MNKIINDISLYGIVPVIKIECLEDAPYLAKALCEGGLPVAEVTFRTACAKEAIISMKKACRQMIIGAGTVLNPAQVNSAIEAGSEFIVSPGLNPKTVQYCLASGCTLEAKSLRDGRAELARMGFRIIGVSPDSEKSHRNFCAKHDLNFTLLADTDHSVCEAYGVWAEKSMVRDTAPVYRECST